MADLATAADPSESALRHSDQIGAEQVAALFRNVDFGVIGATVGSVVLSASLYRLGSIDALTGIVWSGYIATCAAAHLLLRHIYNRAKPAASEWRRWAHWFAGISLAEGIVWGWAPFGLGQAGGFEVVLLIMVVVFGVSAGAVAAFSPYLPAFFAIFLPTTLPYAFTSLSSGAPLIQAGSLLMFVFIAAVSVLSVETNRTFRENVSLRIATEHMAAELRRQKEIAEQASLSKSTFLAAASHDLRQPVHALGLFVGALRGVSMPAEGGG